LVNSPFSLEGSGMKTSPVVRVGNRPGITVAAFLVGLPLTAGLLYTIHHGPWQNATIQRYVTHPVQWAVVGFFCCALGTLLVKLWHTIAEYRACRAVTLPEWDGKPVPPAEANRLAGWVDRLSYRLRCTYIARRVGAVLDFLTQRRSTDGFDDQLRALADADAMGLESSYALTRFITWAIPILGFLGTVLGITGAISGITPEVLEKSLSGVTDGLSEAFDSTALALGLTMLTMFLSFLVEKAEQGVLDHVDHLVDEQLAHRFQRTEAMTAAPQTQELMAVAEQLVQRQAELWAKSFRERERESNEVYAQHQDRLASALETALDRTLQSHSQRLAALEKQAIEQSTKLLEQIATLAAAVRDTAREQQSNLHRVVDMMAAQATTLVQIQTGEKQLIQLQTVMHQNLSALAGAGVFEQAVHNLTAAVHLLTSRAMPLQVAAPLPPSRPTGKAA
jgi:biopolymer transport protein ExbB/TolQ